MRNVVYCGRDQELKGKTAIALPTDDPNTIKIQMDDIRHKHSHGWHVYKTSDWKDDPQCS